MREKMVTPTWGNLLGKEGMVQVKIKASQGYRVDGKAFPGTPQGVTEPSYTQA
jgi:hypothetical protein